MQEIVWAHFESVIRYNIPDSFVIYPAGKDAQAYEKRNFKYNARHQPVFMDLYRMFDEGYRLKDRYLYTYDSLTGILRHTDVRILYKRYVDSFSTRSEKLLVYDTIGNLTLHLDLDYNDTVYKTTGGDSIIFKYNKNMVPVSTYLYYYGNVQGKWIPEKEYTADEMDRDGNPKSITLNRVFADKTFKPDRRFHNIVWEKRCNNLEDIDTLTKEYTVAYYKNGNWVDSLKKVAIFNKKGQVDSAILYVIENNTPGPFKKDIYTYDGLTGYASSRQYTFYEGSWVLIGGTRRILSMEDYGNERYYLKVAVQKYQITSDAKGGDWFDERVMIVN